MKKKYRKTFVVYKSIVSRVIQCYKIRNCNYCASIGWTPKNKSQTDQLITRLARKNLFIPATLKGEFATKNQFHNTSACRRTATKPLLTKRRLVHLKFTREHAIWGLQNDLQVLFSEQQECTMNDALWAKGQKYGAIG